MSNDTTLRLSCDILKVLIEVDRLYRTLDFIIPQGVDEALDNAFDELSACRDSLSAALDRFKALNPVE